MGLPMKRQLLKSIAKSKQKGSPRDDYKVRKPASRARDGKNGNKKMISSSSSAPPYKGSKGSSNDDKTPSKGSKESSNGGKKGNFGRRDWKQEKKDAEETEFETVRVDEMMDDDEQQISSGEEDLSDSASDSDGEAEARMIDDSLKAANRKGKKSGGFQSMG